MDIEKRFNLMFDTYKNQTKFNIILLLLEHEKLNVTQMGKYLGVSRSNLYQTVSQLVKDGILKKPVVVTRKNYVEKYYSLDHDFFNSLELPQILDQITTMTVEETRAIFRAFLMGHTFNLALISEKISQASDEQVLELRDALARQDAVMLYSVHHTENYPGVGKNLKGILDELERNSKLKQAEKGPLMRLMILALPFI